MNQTLFAKRNAPWPDADTLLQGSYLLVARMRDTPVDMAIQPLRALCIEQVESVREHLQRSGLSQASIDKIGLAQCAMFDEAMLKYIQGQEREHWVVEPLQALFFGRHQAGEAFYEDLREVLAEPAASVQVLSVYQRVLMLGFMGRYPALDDPQRLQWLAELDERVAPLQVSQALDTQVATTPGFSLPRLMRSPPGQVLGMTVLLAGLWWGLDQWLASQVALQRLGQA